MLSPAKGHAKRRLVLIGNGRAGAASWRKFWRGAGQTSSRSPCCGDEPYGSSGDVLMSQQLDRPAGAILTKTLEGLGIPVHLKKDTKRVLGDSAVNGLEFGDGGKLDCDLVVIAAGIKANSELAARAGLSVERGIVVDNQLRSPDDPDIYALGECVQHRGLRSGGADLGASQGARRPHHGS